MIKRILLGILLVLCSVQAAAAKINFWGEEPGYAVKGYVEYDTDELATIDQPGSADPFYYFMNSRMSISLNGGIFRSGSGVLRVGTIRYVQGMNFGGLFTIYSSPDEAFSLAVLFPSDIIENGKIKANLPEPAYGEVAYLLQGDPILNTSLNFSFDSPVPEMSTWIYMIAGLFIVATLLRRRPALQHIPVLAP